MLNNLKTTPLHQVHVDSGAMMVDFGGWHMPLRYVGDKKEHHAVREHVGLFDVSHMGEVLVRGEEALALLQYVTCNDVATLQPGQIHYNALMSPQGGFKDDILIYCRNSQDYFVVVNAGNQDKDFAWIQEQNRFNAEVTFASQDYVQIALQGPHAADVLAPFTQLPVREMAYYHFAEGHVDGVPTLVSRTGYTASDGYELYFHPNEAERVWKKLMEQGQSFGITPCGLGARDSLRIEGKMALYGNEINEDTTVLEASLGWIVKLDKGDFIGKDVLARQKTEGVQKKLVGFEMVDMGIPRHGYPLFHGETQIGEVTSGIPSPTLNKSIGMGYVTMEHAKMGSTFEVEIRGKRKQAVVVKTPFYKIQR